MWCPPAPLRRAGPSHLLLVLLLRVLLLGSPGVAAGCTETAPSRRWRRWQRHSRKSKPATKTTKTQPPRMAAVRKDVPSLGALGAMIVGAAVVVRGDALDMDVGGGGG